MTQYSDFMLEYFFCEVVVAVRGRLALKRVGGWP